MPAIDLATLKVAPFESTPLDDALAAFAGDWEGPTQTWFQPGTPVDRSKTRLHVELLERVPQAFGVGEGLYLAHAGTTRQAAERLVRASIAKSRLPEPLRVAHLIGQAIVLGETRGRV